MRLTPALYLGMRGECRCASTFYYCWCLVSLFTFLFRMFNYIIQFWGRYGEHIYFMRIFVDQFSSILIFSSSYQHFLKILWNITLNRFHRRLSQVWDPMRHAKKFIESFFKSQFKPSNTASPRHGKKILQLTLSCYCNLAYIALQKEGLFFAAPILQHQLRIFLCSIGGSESNRHLTDLREIILNCSTFCLYLHI